ncbi:MAG TPA: VOC family protein [Prosthecobacter sp.]
MSINNALAGIAVRNIDTACQWYEHLLGQAPNRPMPEVAEWKFLHGGWLQVFTDETRAGKSSICLAVSDIEDEIRRVNSAGIQVDGFQDTSQAKVAVLQDPEGNQIILAESKTADLAQ